MEIAEENLKELHALPGEPLDVFLYNMEELRAIGFEVTGVYNGVRFNNMAFASAKASYLDAARNTIVDKEKLEQRRDKIRKRAIEIIKGFVKINQGNTHLSTDEIISFIRMIASVTRLTDGFEIPKDVCEDVIGLLQSLGYEPIEPEKAFQRTGEAKKEGNVGIRVWEHSVYIPETEVPGLRSAFREEFSTYVIRNAMAQLREGSIDKRIEDFCFEAGEKNRTDPRSFDK